MDNKDIVLKDSSQENIFKGVKDFRLAVLLNLVLKYDIRIDEMLDAIDPKRGKGGENGFSIFNIWERYNVSVEDTCIFGMGLIMNKELNQKFIEHLYNYVDLEYLTSIEGEIV